MSFLQSQVFSFSYGLVCPGAALALDVVFVFCCLTMEPHALLRVKVRWFQCVTKAEYGVGRRGAGLPESLVCLAFVLQIYLKYCNADRAEMLNNVKNTVCRSRVYTSVNIRCTLATLALLKCGIACNACARPAMLPPAALCKVQGRSLGVLLGAHCGVRVNG